MNDEVLAGKKEDKEDDDCAYLLECAEKNVALTERYILGAAIGGTLIALFSVALNLGVLEISKLTSLGLEFSVKSLFVIRLFTTLAALAALVLLSCIFAQYKRNQRIYLNTLRSKEVMTEQRFFSIFLNGGGRKAGNKVRAARSDQFLDYS